MEKEEKETDTDPLSIILKGKNEKRSKANTEE